MGTKENIIKKLKENKAFYLNFVPAMSVLFLSASLLLIYPEFSSQGVKNGLSVCLDTVIPSLFPFLLVTTAAYDTGAFNGLSAKAEKITSFLFSLPGIAFPIILMSLLGGFPVGASLIEKAFEKGELTVNQARRMLMFCVNPGPAFTVTAIGVCVLGSKQAGAIIYFSVTLSSLIIGILSRFLSSEEPVININKKTESLCCNASVLTASVSSVTTKMLNICSWIIIFSCINCLSENLVKNDDFLLYFKMLSEVTNGAITACEHFSLPIISAVISFAGFCVHFQIMPCIVKLRMKYKYFLAVRAFSAALTCAITFLLINIFPQHRAVISLGEKPQTTSFNVSFPVCVWLMFMCGLFIIGDNYILSKKTDKTERQNDSLY